MIRQRSDKEQQRGSVVIIAYDEPFNPPAGIEKEFERVGIACSLSNCLTEQAVVDFATNKDVILTSSARKLLTRQVLEQLHTCRALVRVGSGIDCIDVAAATDHGIVVVNTPDPLAEEVSDHAAALLLDCARHIATQNSKVKQGFWRTETLLPSMWRMRGKTLGLVGLGRIARLLVEKLGGFKLKYLAYDPYVDPEIAEELDVELVSLEELLTESDFVSIHTQLTAETRHLLGERELRMMKSHAILINTARGGIVDQEALYKALTQGWMARAGLDVLEQEPPSAGDPLLQLENVVLTPHTAAASSELMGALYEAGLQVTIELLNGKRPASVVNPEVQPWWMPV